MRNAIELNDMILDRIVGGSQFKIHEYVTSNNHLFAGAGIISERRINAEGKYEYTVLSLESNKIYTNVPEGALNAFTRNI